MKRTHLCIYSIAILAMANVLFANPIITLDQRLHDTEVLVNTQATTLGEVEVANRVSGAVLVDASALSAQRAQLGAEWGEFLIAHEMARISRTTGDPFGTRKQLTVDRALQLRSEGMSWNKIMTQYRVSPMRLSKAIDTAQPALRAGTPGATNGTGTSGGTVTTGGTTTRSSGSSGSDVGVTTRTNGETRTNEDCETDSRTTTSSRTSSGRTSSGNGRVSNGAAVGIERDLAANVDRLEADADSRGNAAVADRLAAELRVSSDLLVEQRDAFDAEWGDLLIAYTLVGQSRSGVSVGQIFDMRDDGMSWFQIAKSLRVPPGRLMNLVRRGTNDLVETTIAGASERRSNGRAAVSQRTGAGTVKSLRQNVKGGPFAKMNGRKQGGSATLTTGGAANLRATARVNGPMKVNGAARMGAGQTVKMGGGSVSTMRPMTRMGGGIGGGSATRVQGAAGRGNGRR